MVPGHCRHQLRCGQKSSSRVPGGHPDALTEHGCRKQGGYSQAEGMMREVVDAKPGSAKAHYIYAEILAHSGSFSKAAEEAGNAR